MKKKETDFLTEQEAAALLRTFDRRTLQAKRDYTILLTLLTPGLRKTEMGSPLGAGGKGDRLGRDGHQFGREWA